MPFDFTTSYPADLAGALAAYNDACLDPDAADWREIAKALAIFAPKAAPKPRKAKAPEIIEPGEWCEYPAAAHKCRGSQFEAMRQAEIMFADGMVIRVQLGHKKGKDLPDWARACRCAVSFYRAKIGVKMRRGFGLSVNDAEAFALAYPVPQIVLGVDTTRAAEVALMRANAETEAMRLAVPCDVPGFGGEYLDPWAMAA